VRLKFHFWLALLALFARPAAALAQAESAQPYNPFRAEKALEIGEYYLKKGNYDAAIERFKESIGYKPNFALPHRLLGEAYEKKGAKGQAVKYYQKYLEILPHAEDAGKVRKRIEKLTRAIEHEAARSRRASG